MSYDFNAWTTDDAPDLEESAESLEESLRDEADTEASSGTLTVTGGDWTLSGSHHAPSYLAEEAEDMVERRDDLGDEARTLLLEATARIEFTTMPEQWTDDHYNTWLITAETLAELPGVLVHFPFDDEILC